ncbi:MAG: MoaD/ThiS family protein [Planctomycetales bacterium]|nr:MoaD/ThiS family protein [Planctomycetales bacterium]
MEVVVELYAAARERAGTGELPLSLPMNADATAVDSDVDWQLAVRRPTVADLRSALVQRWPDMAALIASSRIAVNCEFVDDGRPLADGDRAALILPVSGG